VHAVLHRLRLGHDVEPELDPSSVVAQVRVTVVVQLEGPAEHRRPVLPGGASVGHVDAEILEPGQRHAASLAESAAAMTGDGIG
jgi:hypothetical protein